MGLLVSVITFLVLLVIGWYVYDYFREPSPKELTQYTLIYRAPDLLKAGHLNEDDWTIIQTPEYSEKGKTFYRNKQEYQEKYGEPSIGKQYIVTYEESTTFKDKNSEKKEMKYVTNEFKVYLYRIQKDEQKPKLKKEINVLKYKGFGKENFKYQFRGISKDDKYVIFSSYQQDKNTTAFFYIDLKDYSLKVENDVPKEYQYKAPDYREFRAFKTVGSINDYTTFFATNNLEMVIDGEKKPKFFEKYPEAEEYMGEDKMMILDCSQASREDKIELTQLLDEPFILETKD